MRTETAETKILSIPVPRALEDFVKERVSSQGFHTVSEYVRALIRADQEQAARQRLEAKLLEAVERGDYREVTPEFWTGLKTIAQHKPTPPRKRKREQP
jgi:putative addiction module CopG family antidote